MVFISASIILTLQQMFPNEFKISTADESKLTFDASLYFVLITITTVGYGDMSPETTLARIMVGIFFIAAVIFFTMQTSEISDLIKQGTTFSRPFKRKGNQHVILASASFNDLKLLRFLREFFHKDHEMSDTMKVVIISKEKPTADVEQVIAMFEESTHLIVGSVFNEKTLERADIKQAVAVFILSNQYDNRSV